MVCCGDFALGCSDAEHGEVAVLVAVAVVVAEVDAH